MTSSINNLQIDDDVHEDALNVAHTGEDFFVLFLSHSRSSCCCCEGEEGLIRTVRNSRQLVSRWTHVEEWKCFLAKNFLEKL
jgi:hypothetical protein